MPAPRRQMALTAELVARAARAVEDAGPSPGAVYLADAEYDALVREGRAGTRPGGRPVGVRRRLAAVEARLRTRESRAATLQGWRRSFRICVARFRGARGLNGLVVALGTGRVSG
jgi:cation transport protein ChaC